MAINWERDYHIILLSYYFHNIYRPHTNVGACTIGVVAIPRLLRSANPPSMERIGPLKQHFHESIKIITTGNITIKQVSRTVKLLLFRQDDDL